MSLLKTAPRGVVRSLEEIFAIAYAMAREAATRYAQLATRARAEGVSELADLFERLAEEKRSHESSVLQWSQQRSGKAPDLSDMRWKLPQIFDEEAAGELAVSRLASAYRVLSMAVRNEERAFALWSYIAAEAETPEIRKAAEKMALQELGHVSLLRRARRQAYHAERAAHPQDRPRSPTDRLAAAAVLERRLADQLEGLAERLVGDESLRARSLAAQSLTMADEVASVASRDDGEAVEDLDVATAAERLVEDYLDVADLSRDESIALLAQSLAKRAISRLAWLHALAATDAAALRRRS
ncbi:MAG: ferritin family protein [Pseudorhodoplanes sp.]|jgi:rubrerythrin|nr:ferritin family protein [Pseudorhodoplanes sp.]